MKKNKIRKQDKLKVVYAKLKRESVNNIIELIDYKKAEDDYKMWHRTVGTNLVIKENKKGGLYLRALTINGVRNYSIVKTSTINNFKGFKKAMKGIL